MNVVIYARVSSTEQVSGYSIDAQVDQCRQWSHERGYQVTRVYIEPGRSARTDDRPEFQKMIRNVCHGEAKSIIVHKVDRFARNLLDLLRYKKRLRDHGATILSISEEFLNGDSPENQLVLKIMGATAEFVAENIRSEVEKGRQGQLRAGRYPGSALPLGYIRVGEKRQSRIERCPDLGPMIRQAFSDFSTGRYTLRSWVQEAKARGYRNRHGNVIARSRWQNIFRNVFYLGRFKWKDEEYQGDHPPLIDEDLWQTVQIVLDDRDSGGASQRHFWLLKDLIWSEVHAKPMTGNLAKGKYAYYRAKGRAGLNPTEHIIRAKDAEDQVVALLETIRASGGSIPAPDEWYLALVCSPHLGLIYPHLHTKKTKRDFLQLVFLKRGLHVNQAGRVKAIYLRPGFEFI